MTQDTEIHGITEINVVTAKAWLAEVTAACNSLDVERIMGFFTDDVFADRGAVVISGKKQVEAYMRPVYGSYTHYELTKTLRAIDADMVIVDARLQWKTAKHERMQHTRALEILQLRNWKICRWDNAAISWEPADADSTPTKEDPLGI